MGFWAGRPRPARNRSRSVAPRHPLPHPSRAATWRHARVRILQLGKEESDDDNNGGNESNGERVRIPDGERERCRDA